MDTETKGQTEEKAPTVLQLYSWQSSTDYQTTINELMYVAFQDENSTARSLEEAMLSKLLSIDVFRKYKRSEWKNIRKTHKIAFTIPHNNKGEADSEFTM